MQSSRQERHHYRQRTKVNISMQKRHKDREQYFRELANTSREFYLSYLRPYISITPLTRVLEIGCGEGGNLLPFAEIGCEVTGIDISEGRIIQARKFFEQSGRTGIFVCQDFLKAKEPESDEERYDLILLHDVIEHIEPEQKEVFLTHISHFLRFRGLVFIGFPPWQMPFGGHQQISSGMVSKLPYVHLLPNAIYRFLISISGNSKEKMKELLFIKEDRMTIERFEQLIERSGYSIRNRTLWFINPHYKQKFHLRPRLLWTWLGKLPYIRGFYTTAVFYLLECPSGR